jgi:hypothetical protein
VKAHEKCEVSGPAEAHRRPGSFTVCPAPSRPSQPLIAARCRQRHIEPAMRDAVRPASARLAASGRGADAPGGALGAVDSSTSPLRPAPVAPGAGRPGGDLGVDRAIRARWHGSGARVRLPGGGLHFPRRRGRGGRAGAVRQEARALPGRGRRRRPGRVGGMVHPDRPGPAADQRLWEAGGGDVHQVYQLPEAVTSWPPSPSAGASYPHGPSAQPPDQYLHGAGNHRPHQVVLLLAGVVA